MDGDSVLSEQQQAALRLVLDGKTSKEISRLLNLSPATVDVYLSRAAKHFRVSNRYDAARSFEEAESIASKYRTEGLADWGHNAVDEEAASSREAPQGIEPRRLFPPLGGRQHDLSAVDVIKIIARVALLTGGTVAALVTIGYWITSIFR